MTTNTLSNLNEMDEASVNAIMDAISKGASIRELQGIPDSVMETIYAYAYKFYQTGRYKEAEVFFRFLVTFESSNADYMMGLAAVMQEQKNYEKAIQAFGLAFALSTNNFRAILHMGQCFLNLKSTQKAKECFEMVLQNEPNENLKAQAGAYLSAIVPSRQEENHV